MYGIVHNWNIVMHGYNLFRKDRQKGGGATLYVLNHVLRHGIKQEVGL